MNHLPIWIRMCGSNLITSMFVGPGIVSREEFFEITESLLKNNPEVSDISVIGEAWVFSTFLK